MTPKLVSITIFVIGISVLIYSFTQPYYKDIRLAENLRDNSFNMDESVYYKQETGLRTTKTILMDVGLGLVIASVAIYLFLFLLKINTWPDFGKVKLLSKANVFILSNILWLLLIPGTTWYYWFRGMRGDYPPFADTIAIPINMQTTGIFISLIPMNIFLLLASVKSKLPDTIFVKPDKYYWRVILIEIFFSIILLLNALGVVAATLDGDHFTIVISLLFLYINLSLRAGQIGKYSISR